MPRILRAAILTVLTTLAVAAPASAQLVINEIDYDQASSDTAEFAEIRNNGSAPVDLDPYALRLVNGAGGGAAVYKTIDLPAVTLAPHDDFVVCGGTVANCDLDTTPDTDLIQNGPPDAVALVNGDTIEDTVSYEGEVPGYTEGPGGAPADTAATGTAQSIARVPDGCDTGVNAADFKLVDSTPGAPNAATSCDGAPPSDTAPSVQSSDPSSGDANVDPDANLRVTFSEPVTADDSAFSLTCGDATIALTVERENETSSVLDPQQSLPRGTSCTLRVEGDNYRDDDSDDPPDTGSDYSAAFTTEPVAGLRIHDLQGASHVSPYRGTLVAGVPGVVTARRTNGYFIQDPQPDRDERTSEGIFVFTSSAPDASLTPGIAVTVSGRVSEFRSGGASGIANLTTTEITSATALPAGTGTIKPTLIGKGGRVPPKTVIEDDVANPGDVEQGSPLFDPREDGIDFYESLEGMVTEIRNAVVVGPTSDFGSNKEIPVLADNGDGATVRAPRGPILVRSFDRTPPQEYRRGDFNPERITLNDAGDPNGTFLPDADVRDRFTRPVRAVVDYNFGNYKFLALNHPPLADGKLKPEVTRRKQRDELAIAGYNVENLDGLDPQDRYDRVAGQIVDNLRSPDILSLEEIQDNDGVASAAPTQADVTFTRLLAAIKAAGGPTYDYREIDPVANQDGGEPNGNIRVAFLFRTDNRDLQFVDRPGGTATTATEPTAGPHLSFSPGRVDPTNPVWADSRKPLAAEFRYRGKPLFVIGNHFNSKGGDDPTFGRFQEPRRSSEVQRHGQADVLNAFVKKILDIDPRSRVVALGDLNDFEFSETVHVLERGADDQGLELVDLWHFVPQDERYSYIFQGNGQVLDHILVSPALLLQSRPDLDAVHINTEFTDQVSDHDPPITRLDVR
jgi:uncharacterized protein